MHHGGHGVGHRIGDDPRRGRAQWDGRGRIRGSMDLALEADSLVELDSLAQELTGFTRDTLPGWHTPQRRAAGEGTDRREPRFARGDAARGRCADSRSTTSGRTPLTVSGSWLGGARPSLTLTATLDSLSRQDRSCAT